MPSEFFQFCLFLYLSPECTARIHSRLISLNHLLNGLLASTFVPAHREEEGERERDLLKMVIGSCLVAFRSILLNLIIDYLSLSSRPKTQCSLLMSPYSYHFLFLSWSSHSSLLCFLNVSSPCHRWLKIAAFSSWNSYP